MDKPEFCPECEQMSLRRYERRQETLMVKGDPEPITVDTLVVICCSWGKDVEDEELDSASLNAAYAEYERRHGVHPSVGR